MASAPGVSVDIEKVEAMMSWERPNVNLRDRISPMGHGLHGWGGLTIERGIEDTWNARDTGVGNKREDQLSPSSGKRQKTSSSN